MTMIWYQCPNDMIFALLDQFKYVNFKILVTSPRFHFIYLVGRVDNGVD